MLGFRGLAPVQRHTPHRTVVPVNSSGRALLASCVLVGMELRDVLGTAKVTVRRLKVWDRVCPQLRVTSSEPHVVLSLASLTRQLVTR